jgi:hypothetical protein
MDSITSERRVGHLMHRRSDFLGRQARYVSGRRDLRASVRSVVGLLLGCRPAIDGFVTDVFDSCVSAFRHPRRLPPRVGRDSENWSFVVRCLPVDAGLRCPGSRRRASAGGGSEVDRRSEARRHVADRRIKWPCSPSDLVNFRRPRSGRTAPGWSPESPAGFKNRGARVSDRRQPLKLCPVGCERSSKFGPFGREPRL